MNISKKVWGLLIPSQRRTAFMLFGLMVIGMVLEMFGVGLVIPLIMLLMKDDLAVEYPAIQPVFELLGNPGQKELVAGGMLCLVGIYLVKNLFLAFLTYQQKRFSTGVQVQIAQRLFTTYLRQPYTFHLQRNSAQLIRNITGEVSIFTNSVIAPSLSFCTEVLVLLGIGMLLLMVEPIGTLIVVLVLFAASFVFHRSTRSRIARWGEARQYHDGMRIQHLQQGLGGAKDVKLFGREEDFLAQYHLHNSTSARVGQMQQTLQALPRLWLELLAVTGLAILVFTMLAQERAMDSIVPTLGLFAAAAFRLMPSVNRVITALQSMRFSRPAINTLHEEMKLEVYEPEAKNLNSASEFKEKLQLNNISYTYPSASAPALKGVSIIIGKRESVGFVGASGAGKSTLVDVILGLLAPDTGQVIVDGEDIQPNLRGWQDQIGYVPQSIFLTDDTLRRNVAFGLSDERIDDDAVRRAIKAAQLEEFVATLPDGLKTVIGERGLRLSGGQRQRIGIARALYHDPPVLVLDEATSSLDIDTELDIMQTINALHGSKTIVIVAHRLSTVGHCDRLYRLDNGRVVEEGETALILGGQNNEKAE